MDCRCEGGGPRQPVRPPVRPLVPRRGQKVQACLAPALLSPVEVAVGNANEGVNVVPRLPCLARPFPRQAREILLVAFTLRGGVIARSRLGL